MKPKANPEPENTTVRLDELTLDPANTRLHPERSKSVLAASLRRFGAARSIVVDGNGVVRAGNGTLEAARAAGIENAIVVDADGGQLIVVRRNDWTPSEATAYSILDNRSTDLSENDDPALVRMLESLRAEGFEMAAVGFTDEDMAALTDSLSGGEDHAGDADGPSDADAHKSLTDRFGVPPFTVLDARQGYWQDRKRAWLSLGIQSELGRGRGVIEPLGEGGGLPGEPGRVRKSTYNDREWIKDKGLTGLAQDAHVKSYHAQA